MTSVPDPRVAPRLRLEVRPADVVDLGGEAEQPSVSVGPVGLGCRLGQAVLLSSAVQHVQRSVLDVNRLLHQGGVQDQVRDRWVGIQRRSVGPGAQAAAGWLPSAPFGLLLTLRADDSGCKPGRALLTAQRLVMATLAQRRLTARALHAAHRHLRHVAAVPVPGFLGSRV